MNETIQIAVRSLVAHVLSRGDLSYGFRGASRNVDAIRAHQRIQKSRPEGYLPEVTVSREISVGDMVLVVSGRIDGVFHPTLENKGGRIYVEEIKTTTGDLDRFETDDNPLHWGQIKTYACMYAHEHELTEIDTHLTYYQLDTGKHRVLKRTFYIGELETFFTDLIGRYLAWASTLVAWRKERDASIRTLAFPYPEYRPGQRTMAVNTYNALRQHRQLLVQAPTGIGKTIAVLFPAVKCLGQTEIAKIFYLTARTTARGVAEKAFETLRASGLRCKSLTLTAKDKTCFEPDAACNGEECPYAQGFYDRIREAVEHLFNTRDAFGRETVESVAREYRVCPFELSLDLANWADAIVCDYNYAFDPRVFLRRFFQEDPDSYAFLIDEAHNLVDRAREMFSAEIRKQPFLDLRKSVKNHLPGLYTTLGRINRCLGAYGKQCAANAGVLSNPAPPEPLAPLLEDFNTKAEKWLITNESTSYREALLDLYFSTTGFMKILDQFDDSYVTCTEKTNGDLRMKLFCMDPSRQLKAALTRCVSAVFFSATLTPVDYFQNLLGCSDTAGRLRLGSPFPEKNLCLLIADRVSTRYRHRPKSLQAVAEAISAAVGQKTGNYLLFFPSYAYLQQVRGEISPWLPDADILLQTPGMSEADRENFLDMFSRPGHRTLLGFVVMGGIFGEGIDLEGDRLSGAVIVGVGLPGISPENELVRDYFAGSCSKGFEYAYVYPGINRVLQAAGRVIRTETDRGIVLLIDERFKAPLYKNLLPEHWHPSYVKDSNQIRLSVRRFWDPKEAIP